MSTSHTTTGTSTFQQSLMNACPIGDSWEVADPEEDMDTTVDKIRLLNEKVLQNIELAQERQKKSYAMLCTVNVGDDVLVSGSPKDRFRSAAMSSQHEGPFTVTSISSKGVATVRKSDGRHRTLNIKRLRPYRRLESLSRLSKIAFWHHHPYWTDKQDDHLYASCGEIWEQKLCPLQDKLAN
ncbi:uncharacterized protein ACB058_010651 [Synchiropus picturatus]